MKGKLLTTIHLPERPLNGRSTSTTSTSTSTSSTGTSSTSSTSNSTSSSSRNVRYLWSPYGIEQTIIFSPCGFFLSIFYLFSSPNLSGRTLDGYHTSTHGVALERI